jgi:hypothetical protein
MTDKLETSGVAVPTVTIAGRVLKVSCSLYAEYQLSLAGVSLADCLSITPSTAVSKIFCVFAAFVAENYESDAPTPGEWARRVSALDDSSAVWLAIVAAVAGAVKKRFPAPSQPAAAEPEKAAAPPVLPN